MVKDIDENDPLERAKKNIERWYSYFSDNIDKFKSVKNFVLGDQWSTNDDIEPCEGWYSPSSTEGLPLLIYNKLYPYVKQIVGQQRKNEAEIRVTSEDENTSTEMLDLISGIIREISYNSDSQIAYQTAFENGLYGFGAIHIYTEYKGPDTFDQEIRIRAVPEPQYAFFDAAAKEPSKGDGNMCGFYTPMSREEFAKKYDEDPDSKSLTNSYFDLWDGDRDTIFICDYFEKEYFSHELLGLDDGTEISSIDLKAFKKATGSEVPEEQVVRRRKVTDYKIVHYRLIRDKVLEKTDWPTKDLPTVFVCGDSHYVDGIEEIKPFVEDAIDPQRFLNFCASKIAELAEDSLNAQFIATPDQIGGMLDQWKNLGKSKRVLLANVDPETGRLPTQLAPTAISQTWLQLYQLTDRQIQSALGLYEANRGMQGNERSGVAILNRVKQGNASTFIYFDNLNRAIIKTGQIVANLLSKIYDTERTVMSRDQNGNRNPAVINQPGAGNAVSNNIKSLKYKAEIAIGASFEVQKEETYAKIMSFMAATPQYAAALSTTAAKYLNVNESQAIIDKMKQVDQSKAQQAQQQMQMEAQKAQQAQQVVQMQGEFEKQRLQTEQMKAVSDRLESVAKAFNLKMGAIADLMDSQVNKDMAESKHLVETAKLDTELRKEKMEVQRSEMALLGKMETKGA